MPTPEDPAGAAARVCQWISLHQALEHFATYTGPTQSQQHIKPLHWYVACRLVLEGGFPPEEITPHPPFSVRQRGSDRLLSFDPALATGGESTVLGGLKTKNVDVVVTKAKLGPVMAVSCKGTIGAFRNLTNRMEEAVGDCTNLHITYPAMISGFLSVLRANRQEEQAIAAVAPEEAPPSRQLTANDIAIQQGGEPVETVIRYQSALRELTGRRGIRNDVSRYEAVSLVLVESNSPTPGIILPEFPAQDSPLRIEHFFQTLYLRYDERYVYAAPDLKHFTRRHEWAQASPVFDSSSLDAARFPALDYSPRIAG
jgi:hypothetical protein